MNKHITTHLPMGVTSMWKEDTKFNTTLQQVGPSFFSLGSLPVFSLRVVLDQFLT